MKKVFFSPFLIFTISTIISSVFYLNELKAQTGTVVDPAGQSYPWKTMADGKNWMTEDLNYEIPSGGSASVWSGRKDGRTGKHYNAPAAKAACQALGNGWRLPSDQEWQNLIAAYGGGYMERDGDLMKTVGDAELTYQILAKGGESGLSLALSGMWTPEGMYPPDTRGFYWSSTLSDSGDGDNTWRYGFIGDKGFVSRNYNASDTYYMACRCIND